jgi:hypothetical protein
VRGSFFAELLVCVRIESIFGNSPRVEAIRKLGFVSGRGEGMFVPNGKATRAEAVVMLVKRLDLPN